MSDVRNVQLLTASHRPGAERYEGVPMIPLGSGIYRLAASPALVPGLAAGDEVLPMPGGTYDLVARGGNVAVQVFADDFEEGPLDDLRARVAEHGGRLDARARQVRVFTVPAAAGFDVIEALFDAFVADHGSAEWAYGNVYDTRGRPLNWW